MLCVMADVFCEPLGEDGTSSCCCEASASCLGHGVFHTLRVISPWGESELNNSDVVNADMSHFMCFVYLLFICSLICKEKKTGLIWLCLVFI